jgi:hypothetical protein
VVRSLLLIGGALVKWPKYFFPPIPTKFGDIIEIALLVNIPNFEAKKDRKVTSYRVFDQKMSVYQ